MYIYEGDLRPLLVHFDTFCNMHKRLFFLGTKDCPDLNRTWKPCQKSLERLPTVHDDFDITTRLLTWQVRKESRKQSRKNILYAVK